METRGGEGKERMRCVDRVPWKLTSPYVCTTGCQRGFAVWLRELKQGLCNNLEGGMGREMGGRFKREGTYVYLWLIHVDVWQTYKAKT